MKFWTLFRNREVQTNEAFKPIAERFYSAPQLRQAAEMNAETVREQQREITRLQGLLAAAGIEYEEKK